MAQLAHHAGPIWEQAPQAAVLVRPGEQGRLRLSRGLNRGPFGPIREGSNPSSTHLAVSPGLWGPI